MFKRLAKQLKNFDTKNDCPLGMTSPFSATKTDSQETFLRSISKQALDLYEKKSDINKFTHLAISNPENTSHNMIVDRLFGTKGFVDPFSEDNMFSLSENERFLKDLGLKD